MWHYHVCVCVVCSLVVVVHSYIAATSVVAMWLSFSLECVGLMTAVLHPQWRYHNNLLNFTVKFLIQFYRWRLDFLW